MNRRAKWWLIGAVAFGLVNLAGAVMAAFEREPMHAATHLALTVLAFYVSRWILESREPEAVPALASGADVGDVTDRLSRLEHSLEGLATGVERVGEGQRFITHLFTESGVASRPDAVPVERSAVAESPAQRS